MKGIIDVTGIFAAVMVYSYIWTGEQDRLMEEIKRRGEADAGRKGGQPETGEG